MNYIIQKIVPFLWFDGNAMEAMNFYIKIFNNSKILRITRSDAGPGAEETVMSVAFQLEGQEFYALNGGPQFKFTEAISFFVNCNSQDELDEYWEKLSEGGEEQGPGWVKDKFGVSWQIVPSILMDMMNDPDQGKVRRVTDAMMQMVKLDIETLKEAYGKSEK